MEVRSDRTPQPARGRVWFPATIMAIAAVVGAGCVHVGRPAVREIVWQGEVAIKGDVVIEKGERLVIRPGTRVLFAFQDDDGDGAGDSHITVKGDIQARGTEAAPIEFAPSNPDRSGAAGWKEVLLEDAVRAEFVRCRFVGAQQAVHAHRAPLTVEDCRFESNGIGLRFTGGPVVISRNRFVANGTAIRYWGSSPLVVGNQFEGNATGLFIRESSAHSVVTGNNFISSTDYHIKLGESQADDVDARDNWWGAGRGAEIERLIYDREDAEYLGRVRYDPVSLARKDEVVHGTE